MANLSSGTEISKSISAIKVNNKGNLEDVYLGKIPNGD
jgi:hypothetical protein